MTVEVAKNMLRFVDGQLGPIWAFIVALLEVRVVRTYRRPGETGHTAQCRLGGLRMRLSMKYRVLIEQDEDGVFVAQVPALPGCVTQGTTRPEALANAREAIAAYLESLEEHDEPIPPPIVEEIIEV